MGVGVGVFSKFKDQFKLINCRYRAPPESELKIRRGQNFIKTVLNVKQNKVQNKLHITKHLSFRC